MVSWSISHPKRQNSELLMGTLRCPAFGYDVGPPVVQTSGAIIRATTSFLSALPRKGSFACSVGRFDYMTDCRGREYRVTILVGRNLRVDLVLTILAAGVPPL